MIVVMIMITIICSSSSSSSSSIVTITIATTMIRIIIIIIISVCFMIISPRSGRQNLRNGATAKAGKPESGTQKRASAAPKTLKR